MQDTGLFSIKIHKSISYPFQSLYTVDIIGLRLYRKQAEASDGDLKNPLNLLPQRSMK
jgi:hypothetical protein